MWARRLWVADDGAVRMPWRLALFTIVAIALSVIAQGIIYSALAPIEPQVGFGLAVTMFGWATVVSLLGAHYVMLRRVDRLPWSASGLGRSAARPSLLLAGATIGALGIGIPTLVLWGIGWMRIDPQPEGSSALAAARVALALLPLAFVEELMVRGYPLTVLRTVLDWRLAVVATSVVFGLLHWWNPGATAWSLTVVTIAGVMLGTIVVRTGSLYAATAAHVAWNWVMAGVFHVPVSGLDDFPAPDFRLVDAGPDWATGGSWGPEGGVGAVLGMGVATAVIYARWRRGGGDARE